MDRRRPSRWLLLQNREGCSRITIARTACASGIHPYPLPGANDERHVQVSGSHDRDPLWERHPCLRIHDFLRVLQPTVHNEHTWSGCELGRECRQPLPAGRCESLPTPIVDRRELGCALVGLLIKGRRQKEVAVTVSLHARDAPLSEQGNAFIGLRTKVRHIPSTDDQIDAFSCQPVESSFQPNQATVGIADNSDSHLDSPFALTTAALSALYPRYTPSATSHRAGRARTKSSPREIRGSALFWTVAPSLAVWQVLPDPACAKSRGSRTRCSNGCAFRNARGQSAG
jgi:hypothetical protein